MSMDRKRFGDGKALAPIFGKKKPRQALLTHPNNSQPKTAPSASYGGGMPCSTSNISMYKNHPGQNCSVQQSHMNGNQFNSSRRQPQQQFNSSRRQPQQQQQAQNQLQQHQLNNQAGIYKGLNVTGMYEKKQQSNYSFITSKVNRQPRMDQLSGIVPQSRICQPSGTMPLSRTVQNSGTMLGRSKGMPVTPRGVRPQQGEIIAMSPVAGHQSWGSPSKPPLPKSHFTGSFYTRASQPVQSIPQTAIDSIESKEKADTSLRLLTTTVVTLQRWSQYRQKITLMFEIFGMLNSAVLTADKATAKEFILKDDTGIIKCIFCQIDRDLNRMTRGQWYRCVGTLDTSTRKLRCVSVRPTSIEERKHSKLFVSASDVAMMEWIKRSREM